MNDPVTASKVATYTGASGAFFFGLTANEFAAIGGLIIGAIGLIANLIFQWRRDAREQKAIEQGAVVVLEHEK